LAFLTDQLIQLIMRHGYLSNHVASYVINKIVHLL